MNSHGVALWNGLGVWGVLMRIDRSEVEFLRIETVSVDPRSYASLEAHLRCMYDLVIRTMMKVRRAQFNMFRQGNFTS